MVSIKKALLYSVPIIALGSGGAYGFKRFIWDPWKATQQSVLEPRGIYLGGHVNHYVDPCSVMRFENMSGQRIDIALRFINFQELRTDKPFPYVEADIRRRRGGTLLLVLEPGSGKKPSDLTFPIGNIPKGDYDKYLVAFGKGAYNYGGPVMLTFRPWRGLKATNAEILAAYRYIREKVISAGAKNIRWVWSVNLNDPNSWKNTPSANEFGWVAVAAYEDDGLNKLLAHISDLKKLGKPIILETGSSARGQQKIEFIRRVKTIVSDTKNGIKAVVFNHVSQFEDGTWKHWSISGADEKAALKMELRSLPLEETIKTSEGYLKDASGSSKTPNCKDIKGSYFTPDRAYAVQNSEEIIERSEGAYKTKGRVPLEYASDQKLELAREYLNLYILTADKTYLKKVIAILDGAFEHPIPNISYGTPGHPWINKYFDLRLRLAEAYQLVDRLKALEECQGILDELKDEELLKAQDVQKYKGKYYTAGYENKAKLIMARTYASLGEFAAAEKLYKEVSEWAADQLQLSWLNLKRKGESRSDISYNGAKANLGIGFIELSKPHGNLEKSRLIFMRILSWPEVGKEKGFMDLGYEALIGLMRVCAESSDDPAQIKAFFESSINWKQFNGYKDFKKSLMLEKVDLSNPQKIRGLGTDRMLLLLNGLQNVSLSEPLKADLVIIRAKVRK